MLKSVLVSFFLVTNVLAADVMLTINHDGWNEAVNKEQIEFSDFDRCSPGFKRIYSNTYSDVLKVKEILKTPYFEAKKEDHFADISSGYHLDNRSTYSMQISFYKQLTIFVYKSALFFKAVDGISPNQTIQVQNKFSGEIHSYSPDLLCHHYEETERNLNLVISQIISVFKARVSALPKEHPEVNLHEKLFGPSWPLGKEVASGIPEGMSLAVYLNSMLKIATNIQNKFNDNSDFIYTEMLTAEMMMYRYIHKYRSDLNNYLVPLNPKRSDDLINALDGLPSIRYSK